MLVARSIVGWSKVRASFSALLALAGGIFLLSAPAQAQVTAYCFGDGSGTACPCSNSGFPGGGCSNSSFPGAIFSSQGSASLANDTLLLRCVLVPFDATAQGILFQGATQANGGMGTPFGAGLRCISGTVRRLGIKTLATGTLEFGPSAGDMPLHVRGAISAAGTQMNYQIWFRDTLAGCTPTFNTSNGLRVVWAP